jgi:hypothetical protein
MKLLQAVAVSEYMNQKIAGQNEGVVGKVLSLHSDLFNIILSDGELLTAHSPEHLRTPMSVEVFELPLGCVESNADVCHVVQPNRLICGECIIDLGQAETFSSRAVVLSEKRNIPQSLLLRHFATNRQKLSVFHYLGLSEYIEINAASADTMTQRYGEVMRNSVKQLMAELRSRNSDLAAEAALRLIGLGPGMTPAGDDFLQGFFLFAKASEKYGETVKRTLEGINNKGILDTTLVSRELWRHFFAGRVGQAPVSLVEAYNADAWEKFSAQLKIIGKTGHSSGDDFLSGVYVAVSELFYRPSTRNQGGGQQC